MDSTINDCFVSAIGRKPNNGEIETIKKSLYTSENMHIYALVGLYGWNDTEVRDGLYKYIKGIF